MADREIKVKLSVDGKEYETSLGKAAEKTESFGDKIKGLAKTWGAFIGGAAIGAFFKSAIDEASKAEVGMGRLGQAVSNAGGNFSKLRPQLEQTVSAVMRMSTATDDDLRESLTRMIAVSGDVAGSQKNLALVTDLAAYKQISLSDAADIVAKAMNGNTTALNKMGVAGKDATTVLENARATFGGFAEQEANTFSGTLQRVNNQWGEFQEAVGTAILSGDTMGGVADGLVGVLANLASWVEANEGSFRLVTGAIGDAVGALVDVAKTIWEVNGPALQFIGKYLGGALIAALNTAVFGVRSFAAAWQYTAGVTLDALGWIAEKGGAVLKVFGVTVVSEAGASMRAFGEQLKKGAAADVATATQKYQQSWTTLLAGRKDNNAKAEAEERRSGATRIAVLSDAEQKIVDAQNEAARERVRISEEATRLILVAADKLQKGLAKTGGSWDDIKKSVDKAYGSVLQITAGTGNLAAAATRAAEENARIKDEAAKAKQRLDDNVDSAQSLGISFISAANGMGLINDKAAQALTSVVNMGAAIVKFGVGSPEGIIAIVGGLAQLIGGWGSSAVYQAQQEASMKNTRALEELTRDLSDYNGAASGRTFSGVLDAIQEESTLRGGAAYLSPKAIEENLRKRGLTLADAKKIAERYGIDLDSDQEGWSKLLGVLTSRKFGSGQGNFADELASITESFDVLGTDDADDKLKAFREFTAKNIPILNEALQGDLTSESGRTAAIQRLRALYQKSIKAEIPPADYKNATPQQFRQLIASLLPLLGDANGLLASGDALGTGSSSTPIGGVPPTGGSVGSVAGPPVTAGLGGGVPTPSVPDAFAGFGAGSTNNTINYGGVSVMISIDGARDASETAEEVAARVASILGTTYTRQRTALGLAT